MIIIPQDEFIKARNESKKKIDDVFFVDEIYPIILRNIGHSYYTIILKAVQKLKEEAIFFQLILSAEEPEDIYFLNESNINERKINNSISANTFVRREMQGINQNCTYSCDFDMHLDKNNLNYYTCSAIRVSESNKVHDEIKLMITKDSYIILTIFLSQITNRLEFLQVFTNPGFRKMEFINAKNIQKNSSCITKLVDGKEAVLTHYTVTIGPRIYGFAFMDTYNKSKELKNKMSEKDWTEWYKNDPIITNIIEDEKIYDGKVHTVIDIIYPITSEVKDNGETITIQKPYKVLQIEQKNAKLLTPINPNIIYK